LRDVDAATPIEVYEAGDAALRVVARSPDRERNWTTVHSLAAWLEWEYGPDLERVAEHVGLSVDDVVTLHTEKSYVIRCLGAPAGSPMMDGPDFTRPVPRLKDPRLSVPAGAVSVAGRQEAANC
jgi:allophanate hydrolase subunit 1